MSSLILNWVLVAFSFLHSGLVAIVPVSHPQILCLISLLEIIRLSPIFEAPITGLYDSILFSQEGKTELAKA